MTPVPLDVINPQPRERTSYQRYEQRQIDLICMSQLTSFRETIAAPIGGSGARHSAAVSQSEYEPEQR